MSDEQAIRNSRIRSDHMKKTLRLSQVLRVIHHQNEDDNQVKKI